MRPPAASRAAAAILAFVASGVAAAQVPPDVPAEVQAPPGVPASRAVDPDPGAAGPYAGHSEHAFYDVDGRIAAVQTRAEEGLTGGERGRALKAIADIRAEERDQIARHGQLLDWARENLNHRLDGVLKAFPALRG